MIENLSSKIDSLSGKTPNTVTLEVNETNPESLIPTSRPIEVNELLRDESQHMVTGVINEPTPSNNSYPRSSSLPPPNQRH